MQYKTIAAVATPPGTGGISVIRISGENAISIADRIYQGKTPLSQCATHTIHYGHIVDRTGSVIDEVLVSIMHSPRTYTGEDVIEINTHGGVVVTNKVLDLVIEAGAAPAEPGEFTKRAFLNGRIDLSKAEAVIDLINAKNDLARQNAVNQLGGRLSEYVEALRQSLLDLAAHMQVSIDYPDEDLEEITQEQIIERLQAALDGACRLLDSRDNGRIITDGIATAIVGKPNVGKSSLLNYLSGTDRAIVTEIAGTTRDVIEESVSLGGVPLRLIDTAGIRETEDTVEKIGVERSLRSMEAAELILAVIDGASGIEPEDEAVLAACENRNRIILVNKTDVEQEPELPDFPGETVIFVSAKTGGGMKELEQEISRRYRLGELSGQTDLILTNRRHIAALLRCREALENGIHALRQGLPQDLAALDLNEAIAALGEITGASVSDDIVSAVFSGFCVGK